MPRSWILFLALAGSVYAQWNLAVKESSDPLRGVHSIGGGIVWASGANGTILRSEDDGYMWQRCTVPPGAGALDFRAIYGWSGDHAVAMSIGNGPASRLYETTDGCASWHLLFQNPDKDGFWDSLSFHETDGYILGDPVGGRFVVYHSADTGRHWKREDDSGLAAAHQGEGAFAASNSALTIRRDGGVLFGTGGLGGPHVFRRNGEGRWKAITVPLRGGNEAAGVFSLAFRDNQHGVAVGGDYKNAAKSSGTAAWTSDGGASWHPASVFPAGYRSSVGWDARIQTWIAGGPSGTEFSTDDGKRWQHLDSGSWNAVNLPWIVGPNGRVASLDLASPALSKLRNARPGN